MLFFFGWEVLGVKTTEILSGVFFGSLRVWSVNLTIKNVCFGKGLGRFPFGDLLLSSRILWGATHFSSKSGRGVF